MGSLGTFGVVHPPRVIAEGHEPDTFDYFGVSVRTVDEVDDLDLVDFLDSARNIDTAGLMGLTAVKDGLRILIDERDFDLFWRTARENRQTIEDLSKLFQEIMEGETDRPTRQPSDSSLGRQSTVASSPEGSTSTPVSNGRPDLQIIHDDAAATMAKIEAAARAG